VLYVTRGTEEYFGLSNRVDIINSTLGKALGGAAGGYTTGPKELIHLLRQRSRPYLFSNSLPPPVVAVAQKVFLTLPLEKNIFKNLLYRYISCDDFFSKERKKFTADSVGTVT
jgi:7-keto-8-aminopelargonate synthetase-like enzyme